MHKFSIDPTNYHGANFDSTPYLLYSSSTPNRAYKELVRDKRIPISISELLLIRSSPDLLKQVEQIYTPLKAETILTANFLHIYRERVFEPIHVAIDSWQHMPVASIKWDQESGHVHINHNHQKFIKIPYEQDFAPNIKPQYLELIKERLFGPSYPYIKEQLVKRVDNTKLMNLNLVNMKRVAVGMHLLYPISLSGLTHQSNMDINAKENAIRTHNLVHVIAVKPNFDQKRRDSLQAFGINKDAINTLNDHIN
jgi:hypothetical protein